jgi:hypothetical protein
VVQPAFVAVHENAVSDGHGIHQGQSPLYHIPLSYH